MNEASLSACRLIPFGTRADTRGSLVVMESPAVPFPILRCFLTHGVPTGSWRGAHAHRELSELLVCVSGKCSVRLTDGNAWKEVALSSPESGLLVPPMVWAEQEYLLPDTVLLVLASDVYRESDYIRSFDDFILARGSE